MRTCVLFHQNCPDGHGAAWAAWKKLGDEGVKYVPVKYGDSPPTEKVDFFHDRVYILDFSYPRAIMLGLYNMTLVGGGELLVIDHHKTAEADLEGLLFAHFNMEKSGAVLAWEHFHPDKPVPWLLRYVEDHDLWRYKLPYSKEIRAWLSSHPRTFEVWEELAGRLEGRDDGVIVEGKACLRLMRQSVEYMVEQSRIQDVGGVVMPVANAAIYFSEVGEALLAKYLEYDVVAYYFDRADGKRQWGLRSRESYDCSELAKRMGGGGHRNASGFIVDGGM